MSHLVRRTWEYDPALYAPGPLPQGVRLRGVRA